MELANRSNNYGDWVWPAADVAGWSQQNMELPAIFDLILKHAVGRDAIVQAGGCCGLYPRLYAGAFETVYTFEPDPLNFICLVANCPNRRIVKIQAALGEKPGSCNMMHEYDKEANSKRPDTDRIVYDANCGGHHIVPDSGYIPVLALDSFDFPKLDVLQLDCESWEIHVLRGAQLTIVQHKPLIVVEAPTSEVLSFLALFGYQRCGWAGSNPDVAFKWEKPDVV